MSQKPFMWNDNNPVEWSDPNGYCVGPLVVVCAWVLGNLPEITAAAYAVFEGFAGTGGSGVIGAGERGVAEATTTIGMSDLRVIGGYPQYLAGERLGMKVFNRPGLTGRALEDANKAWVSDGIAQRNYFVLTPGQYGKGTAAEIKQLEKAGYTPIKDAEGVTIGFAPPKMPKPQERR